MSDSQQQKSSGAAPQRPDEDLQPRDDQAEDLKGGPRFRRAAPGDIATRIKK